jgi:5-methylcytosine-specific restriction endonuclease McrA
MGRKKIHYDYYAHCKSLSHALKVNGCAICGYDKCKRALHFHHINPKDKKFSIVIDNIRRKKTNDMVNELNKCILLCSNCHMEIEEK